MAENDEQELGKDNGLRLCDHCKELVPSVKYDHETEYCFDCITKERKHYKEARH